MMSILAKKEWLEKLRNLHAKTAFGAMGGEVVDVDDASLELRLEMSEATLTPFGYLHGGISMFLAETAASTHACWGIDLEKRLPMGIEINGSHVRSAKQGTLIAQATLLNRTRKLTVHDVRILIADTGELLSTCRVTNYYRNISPNPPL